MTVVSLQDLSIKILELSGFTFQSKIYEMETKSQSEILKGKMVDTLKFRDKEDEKKLNVFYIRGFCFCFFGGEGQ